MDTNNITVTINDACCTKNCNTIYERTLTNFTLSNYSNLQNNYVFTVLNITNNTATIVIQNGICYYIRTLPLNQPTPFCIPCRCGKHIITITVNTISTL